MNHPLNIPDIIVGGMLMLSSAFALIFTWKRRELVRGLSYKIRAVLCRGNDRRRSNCSLAIYLSAVIQRIYYIVCRVAGLCIAGLLGYFGAHIPLRVVLFGVGLSTITLFIIFLWIERWLKKHY